MNFAQLTGVRNIARKLGLTRLLTIRQRCKAEKSAEYYLKHQPAYAPIALLGHEYKLNTSSPFEWSRANAVYDDEHIIKSILRFLKPGEQIWDIGASIGAYTCLFASACGEKGKVYAFEPEHVSREMLSQNLRLNQLNNVTVYDVALGHEHSILKLYPSESAVAGTHRLNQQVDFDKKQHQTVIVERIDDLRIRDGIEVPAVIKIDVEGWEENVLLGGINTISQLECRAIMIEMHFSIFAEQKDNKRANRIQLIMQNAGFTNQTWVDPSHLLSHR